MRRLTQVSPILAFHMFALLVAARDAFTHRLLNEKLDPIFVLFVYCATTTVVALTVNLVSKRGSVFRKLRLEGEGFVSTTLGLGLLTWLTFMATIFGIKAVGASIFSFVEHGLMPVATAVVALRLLKERVSPAMAAGLVILTAGVLIFLIGTTEVNPTVAISFRGSLGIALAIAGSVLTSITSGYQKKLVSTGHSPDEILILRFALPTLLMSTLLPFAELSGIAVVVLVKLIATALLGFALPLVLLCGAFMRSSLGRFSAYIILIPAYTFILGPIAVDGELSRLADPCVITGICAITLGYFIFEGTALRLITTPRTRSANQEKAA